jgi:DNA-binding beta-propeller fold protein YncE
MHLWTRIMSIVVVAAAAAGLPSVVAAQPPAPATALSVVSSIPGPDGKFDYASVDSAARRLYVARFDGVSYVDLTNGQLTPRFVAGTHVHSVIVLPSGRALSTNGDLNTATLFETATGTVIAQIPTGQGPDAATFDGLTGMALVMNAEGGDATLIDPQHGTSPGTIPIGGKLEFAVSDHRGHVYVNVENTAEIAVLDIAARRVMTRYRLKGCDKPSGLGLDTATGVLVTACRNQVALALRASDGVILSHLSIGRIPDAVIVDPARKAFFIPCGRDGNLAVIDESGSGAPTLVATIPTSVGAHTGALDPVTGRLYLPTAKFHLTFHGIAAAPGSFRILVLDGKG